MYTGKMTKVKRDSWGGGGGGTVVSAGMISGPFDSSIDGGITFYGSNAQYNTGSAG